MGWLSAYRAIRAFENQLPEELQQSVKKPPKEEKEKKQKQKKQKDKTKENKAAEKKKTAADIIRGRNPKKKKADP